MDARTKGCPTQKQTDEERNPTQTNHVGIWIYHHLSLCHILQETFGGTPTEVRNGKVSNNPSLAQRDRQQLSKSDKEYNYDECSTDSNDND